MFSRLFKLSNKQESSQPITIKPINVDRMVQPDSVLKLFVLSSNLLEAIATRCVLVIVEDEALKKQGNFNIERRFIYKEIFECKAITVQGFVNQTMSDINKLIHIKQQYEAYKNNFERIDSNIREYIHPQKLARLTSVGKEYIDECRALDLIIEDLMNTIGRYILKILIEKDNFIKLSTLTDEEVGTLNAESRSFLDDNYDTQRRDMGTAAFYQLIPRAHAAVVAFKIKPTHYKSICDDPSSAVSNCRRPAFSQSNI